LQYNFSFQSKQGQYIAAMNLGGALTWTIETDDFKGICYGTPFILTKAIVEAMNGPTNLMPTNPCASGYVPPPTPDTTTTTSTKVPTSIPVTPSTTTGTTIASYTTPSVTSTSPSCTCAVTSLSTPPTAITTTVRRLI
jgi:chitinase